MEIDFRCDCPFTSALDVFGDKWMLVIVKQILVDGKRTFTEFVESDESIATNVLSTKLKQLEAFGMVLKTQRPDNRKTNLYILTDKGLALAPMLVELALWSDQNLREVHPILRTGPGLDAMKSDKGAFADWLVKDYRQRWPLPSA